ncbi:MAG: chain length determinant protein EpsF [Rugosibacter sp.]
MNPSQLLLCLRARYRIVLLGLFGTVLVALAVSLMMPKRYTATAAVVVDVKSPDPVAGMTYPAMTMPGYMATQVDIINSDRVTYRVIRMLGFDKKPELQQQWQDARHGRGTFESWFGDFLQHRLEVKPSHDSNVINITFKAWDPKYASLIANAFVQAYIDTNIELRTGPAGQYAMWFNQQSKALRDRVEEAQARLSEYQQKHGIISSDQHLDYENQKLNDLQSQVVLAQTANAEATSKQKGGAAESVQDAMQSPPVQQLKTEIAMQQAKLQDAAKRIGPNHPQYQSIQAQIDELKRHLADETARVSASIETSRRASSEKVGMLKSAIEAQKRNILGLRSKMDEAAVLQRELDAAQKAYDTVADRFSQSNLESKSTQTNISVLTPAVEPAESASPKIPLNLAIATMVGLMLGIAAAVLLELRDRRIRSVTDVEYVLGMPMLVTVAPLAKADVRRLRKRHPRVLTADRHAPPAGA